MSEITDDETCIAQDYGHVCLLQDGHTGLHYCSCSVRWVEEFPS
jgi:hypothetical protein